MQAPLAGIEPPVKVTVEVVEVTVPPQVVLGVEATVTPPGSVSVSAAVMLAAVPLLLLKVMVRVELPPALMVAGLKALPSVGAVGGWGTVKVATAGPALEPLPVCRAPMAKELR